MGEDFNITELFPKMSLAMKQRWWAETNYNQKPPSDELKNAILEDIAIRALGGPGEPKLS